MLECKSHKVLMKGWILNVVRLNIRCDSHIHLCWQTLFLILWGHWLPLGCQRMCLVLFMGPRHHKFIRSNQNGVPNTIFWAKTLAILGIQLIIMWKWETPYALVRSKNIYIFSIVPKHVSKANCIEVCKVYPKALHVAI
jgi:hypothetical protein